MLLPNNHSPHRPKRHNRLIGLGLTLLGGGLCYWQIWMPLQAARAHLTEIGFSNSLQFVATALAFFGLELLVVGNRVVFGQHAHNQQKNDKPWILTIAALAAGLVVNQWVRIALARLGYPNP